MKNILHFVAAWIMQGIGIMHRRAKLYSIIFIAIMSIAGTVQATIIKFDVEGHVYFGGPVIDAGTAYKASFIVDNSIAPAPILPSPSRTTFQNAILGFTMEIAGVTISLDDFNERNDINQYDVSGGRDYAGFILGNTLDIRPGRDADALAGTLNRFDAHNLVFDIRSPQAELFSDRELLLNTAAENSDFTNFSLVRFQIAFLSIDAPFLAQGIALTTDSIFVSEVPEVTITEVPLPPTLSLMLFGVAALLLLKSGKVP